MSDRARHRRPVGSVASPGQRHDWVDAGRGLAIILVVLVHSRDWLDTAGLNLGAWEQVNNVLAALRMPLFFTISGLLGAKWVTAGWPRLLSQKITVLVWVYLLWQPIGLLAALVADRITGAHQGPLHFLIALAATVVRPRSELWFLWALTLYFVLARLGARARIGSQLLVAGVISAVWLSGLVPVGNQGWNGVPKYYLFFLIGIHHRELILWLAARSRRSRLLSAALIVGWVATATVSMLTGAEDWVPVGLATRLLGLAAGIALAGILARWRLLGFLGARTLPIYLAHTPIIIVLAWIVHTQRGAGWVLASTPLLPVLVTAVVVPLTVALHRLLSATPARILYAPPERVRALVQRLASAPRWRSAAAATQARHRPRTGAAASRPAADRAA